MSKHIFCRLIAVLALFCLFGTLFGCDTATDTSSEESSTANEGTVQGIPVGELTDKESKAFSALSHHYLKIDNTAASKADGKKVEVAADGSFFDDFNNGIDPDIWAIAQRAWGGNNHGVQRANVAYTADGVLVLTANGDWYKGPLNGGPEESEGVRSGACIVTQKNLGAGSYEARIKAAPQMGACTAMWTFFYGSPAENHEIDIEIPASTKSFKNSQFVTWTSENDSTDRQTVPSFYHNDGQWHTYRFDWHTEPKKVDFYVDNELQVSIDSDVPDIAGNLWLGVWFPQRWCGVPIFDTTYMLVDWFKYTAFDEEVTPTDKEFAYTPDNAYPSEPIVLPTVNFISNGGFEEDSVAWSTTNDASVVENPTRENNRMLRLGNEDASVTELLSSIIPESEYRLNISGFGDKKSTAKVKIEYLPAFGNEVIGTEELILSGSAFEQTDKTITTPADTGRIRLTLSGEGNGPFYFDDLYLTQPIRGDFNVVS